jgi:hypothetical protein
MRPETAIGPTSARHGLHSPLNQNINSDALERETYVRPPRRRPINIEIKEWIDEESPIGHDFNLAG